MAAFLSSCPKIDFSIFKFKIGFLGTRTIGKQPRSMPKKSAKVIKCTLQVVVVANSEEQEPSELCENWYTFEHGNFNLFRKYIALREGKYGHFTVINSYKIHT